MPSLKKIAKWSLITLLSLILLLGGFGYWFINLIPVGGEDFSKTTPNDLPYLAQNKVPNRGKILAVVTSTDIMGSSEKSTGYELTELSRAYYVFEANGFEVDVASPKGGDSPVIIDDEDMGPYDFAFLNDPVAKQKSRNTIPLAQVNPEAYQAIYFVGGKGAMFDFPQNADIQSIVQSYYESDKVIGAVCHGPAALVNVSLSDGSPLLKDKTISSFTNHEELFLIPDAASIFPFLLEDKLVSSGARFNEGTMYLENVSQDGKLVTGQNPWSTWKLAETMIEQMGYTPKVREITPDENTIHILGIYTDSGYGEAKDRMTQMYKSDQKELNRTLLAMHSVVSAMQWRIGKSIQLIRLLAHAKSLSES